MAGLKYDGNGVNSSTIGTAGITPAERDGLSATLDEARQAMKAAWDNGELGFLGCADADAEPYLKYARELRESGRFTHQVVIGIGGSSLGARAVLASSTEPLDGLKTHFSENMDPVGFLRLIERLDLQRTMFVVISKSGTTIETMSKFAWAWSRMQELVGEQASDHFVAITDPARGELGPIAKRHGFPTFPVPPNVGGRFSVLTAVGLLPLAVAGYPIERLLAGSRAARTRAMEDPVAENAQLQAAADHFLLMDHGISQTVMMVYSDVLYPLADWFCQLWGESLGKARRRDGELVETGLTPVRALGVVDQHSQIQLYAEGPRDKHVVFVETQQFAEDLTIPADALPDGLSHLGGKSMSEILGAELRGTRAALRHAGRPTSTWSFEVIEPEAIGGFIMAWEFITAVMGELLDVNAFDQPGVELGKKIAHGLLGRDGFDEFAAMVDGMDPSDSIPVI